MGPDDPEQTLVKKLAGMIDDETKQDRVSGLKLCTCGGHIKRVFLR